MRVRPSDPSFLPDLLAFLREAGCLAHYVDGTDAVMAWYPELPEHEEERLIRGLCERWRQAHPKVEVVVVRDDD
jgi:hypothetical protein